MPLDPKLAARLLRQGVRLPASQVPRPRRAVLRRPAPRFDVELRRRIEAVAHLGDEAVQAEIISMQRLEQLDAQIRAEIAAAGS